MKKNSILLGGILMSIFMASCSNDDETLNNEQTKTNHYSIKGDGVGTGVGITPIKPPPPPTKPKK